MWMMLQQEKPDDYVVATGESRSVREFLDASFSLLGLNWQDYVKTDAFYTRPSEVDFLKGDAAKARKKLGWQPKTSFQEMVKIMTEHDLDLAERELHARQFQKS
jgi:GDPmannose 4,6-dehydratase